MHETTTLAGEIEIHIAELADELTGRGDGLRKSKPKADGFTQYVWRMSRFHGGYDTSMPVTAAWWLQEYLDENGIDAKVSGILDDSGKEITREIEEIVDDVLAEFGEDSTRGARRWKSMV